MNCTKENSFDMNINKLHNLTVTCTHCFIVLLNSLLKKKKVPLQPDVQLHEQRETLLCMEG